MRKTKVSVLMPNYNGEKYISEAITSVLNQSFSDFELIIIDDCSTDSSWKIIKSFTDKRIKAFRNASNLHITKTRNKLLSLAKGEYLAMLDSDDVMLVHRLEKQVAFLEKNKEFMMVGSDLLLIDSHSKKIGVRKYPKEYSSICKQMLVRNPFAQSSVMIRNKGFVYDESFSVSEDYALWCEIASKYKVANLPALIKYRIHVSQTVHARLKEHLLSVIRIQQKWLKHPLFRNYKSIFQHYLFLLARFFPSFILRWLK